MYKIKEIHMKPGQGVDIIGDEIEVLELADGSTREVVKNQNHAMTIGINDYAADPRNPTEADHELARQKISEKLRTLLADSDADLVAQAAVLTGQLNAEREAKARLVQERDSERTAKQTAQQELQAERSARQALAAQLEEVRNEAAVTRPAQPAGE